MTHAIRIHEYGGPDVMKWEGINIDPPQPYEIRIRNKAIGLNFIDTYHRSGLYPVPLPATLGREGAGIVEALGVEINATGEFKIGDRVAYALASKGSYTEVLNITADQVVKLPDSIPDELAASMMLKGLTAQYLLRQSYRVSAGDTILIHAAAGGVGLLLTQWAKYLGATVIGTVSNEEKAKLAYLHGCDHIINYKKEDFVSRVAAITNGQKCDVVYDGVGKDTFMKSLDCASPLGLVVAFGNASGAVPPFDIVTLSTKGSLFIQRPNLAAYVAKRENLLIMAQELFDVVDRGVVKVAINQTYPLREAAEAHRDLEARKTTGSTVLLP